MVNASKMGPRLPTPPRSKADTYGERASACANELEALLHEMAQDADSPHAVRLAQALVRTLADQLAALVDTRARSGRAREDGQRFRKEED